MKTVRVAVVGNPNAGKTTLFNALTGLSQKVANFPGVTVERKSGKVTFPDGVVELIDLPGTYSLAAHSPDEMVAVDVLLGQQDGETPPDGILSIVDASNLERNLYLVSQLLDLGRPVIVVLNMTDVARRKGVQIDATALSRRLGVPILETRADRKEGIGEVRRGLEAWLKETRAPQPETGYEPPESIRTGLAAVESRLRPAAEKVAGRPLHDFELLRVLVDQGGHAEARLREHLPADAVADLDAAREGAGAVPLSALEAQSRYRWIRTITEGCIERREVTEVSWSDRLDRLLTHRFWGTLVFAAVMLLLFQTIFTWAGPLMDAIDAGFGWIGETLGALLPEGAIRSLLVDGVVAGVGGVVIFLPQILLLFLLIGLLEDCGYMARAAFLMDRLMSSCGLSGKSFIPMLSGLACAIPAVMATRVIEDRRDRIATILVAPLMTCSARLPLYTILIAAFVPDRTVAGFIGLQALTMFGLYVLGVVAAMGMAWVFKRTLLRGPVPPFVLELPGYKIPQLGSVALRLADRGSAFVKRAGTIILAMSIIVWALAYFPRPDSLHEEYNAQRAALEANGAATEAALEELEHAERSAYLEQSLFGRMGHGLAPVFKPLGWDWRITMATIASFPAREIVVSTLGTIYSLGDETDEESEDLREAMQAATWPDGRAVFTLPVALSLMVFFALCCQCGATVAVIKRETNSWGWAWLTFGYMTALAYVGGFATRMVGEMVL